VMGEYISTSSLTFPLRDTIELQKVKFTRHPIAELSPRISYTYNNFMNSLGYCLDKDMHKNWVWLNLKMQWRSSGYAYMGCGIQHTNNENTTSD